MSITVNRTIRLVQEVCCVCDLTFGVPDYWQAKRLRLGDAFYCPAGHKQWYGESENVKLKRQLKAAQARATHADDQRQAAERSARAYKGQVTRLRNKVGRGECPCCGKEFAHLARHMERQHPDFADGEVTES
jgi:ubiquitin